MLQSKGLVREFRFQHEELDQTGHTHNAETKMKELNFDDWTTTYRKHKWRWAANVTQQKDDRWTQHAISWMPLQNNSNARRNEGHQCKRWDDDINEYLTAVGVNCKSWMKLARDSEAWAELE